MLDKTKLYYLSHPCTTYGEKLMNIKDVKRVEILLKIRYGIKVINPIVIMPSGVSEQEAMHKCSYLYKASDEVIFCQNWRKSKGCNEEYWWTLKDKKPYHFLNGDAVIEFDGAEGSELND